MAILEQLGINQSIFFQLAIFIIAFLTLWFVAFDPYNKALEAREEKTKGGEDLAQEIYKRAIELKNQYENKARRVSSDIKTIFDSHREEANKHYYEVQTKAREESQKLIEEVRQRVSIEISEATKKLKEEVPQVAASITQKLLAK